MKIQIEVEKYGFKCNLNDEVIIESDEVTCNSVSYNNPMDIEKLNDIDLTCEKNEDFQDLILDIISKVSEITLFLNKKESGFY